MGGRLLDENIVIHVAEVAHRPFNEVCDALSQVIDTTLGERTRRTTCVGGPTSGPLLGMDNPIPLSLKRTSKPVPDYGLRLARHLAFCARVAESASTPARGQRALDPSAQRAVTTALKSCVSSAYRFEDLYQGRSGESTQIPPPQGTADRYLIDLLDGDREPVAFVTEDVGPDTHTRRQVTVIADHGDLDFILRGSVKEGVRPPEDPVRAAGEFLAGRLRRSGLAVLASA